MLKEPMIDDVILESRFKAEASIQNLCKIAPWCVINEGELIPFDQLPPIALVYVLPEKGEGHETIGGRVDRYLFLVQGEIQGKRHWHVFSWMPGLTHSLLSSGFVFSHSIPWPEKKT